MGVSGCHCHQFLPSFRKEAFGAGSSWHLTLSVEEYGDRDNLGQLQGGAKAVGGDSHMGEYGCAPPAWGADVPPHPEATF